MRKHILPLLFLPFGLLLFAACNRNNGTVDQRARFQVRLTDDPGNFEAVYIDVREIKINRTDADDAGWETLEGVLPGVYNVLDLVNDKDTLLADAFLPSGRINQIRLVLGPNNSIVLDGETFPLQTPSAQQSGLKLNVQQEVNGGIMYVLLLDFDVARSIVKTGNGRYILKPVIRTVLNAVGGSLQGVVLPDSVRTGVLVLSGNDTIASTFTEPGTGGFFLKGLPEGSYRISFNPDTATSFTTFDLNNVGIRTGEVTRLDTIRLN
jgi:hypothetical protein